MAHRYWTIGEREFNKGTNYKGVDKTKELREAVFSRVSYHETITTHRPKGTEGRSRN